MSHSKNRRRKVHTVPKNVKLSRSMLIGSRVYSRAEMLGIYLLWSSVMPGTVPRKIPFGNLYPSAGENSRLYCQLTGVHGVFIWLLGYPLQWYLFPLVWFYHVLLINYLSHHLSIKLAFTWGCWFFRRYINIEVEQGNCVFLIKKIKIGTCTSIYYLFL